MQLNPLMLLAPPALLLGFGMVRVQFDGNIQASRAMQADTARMQVMADLEAQSAQAQNQTAINRYQSGVCQHVDQLQVGQQFQAQPGTLLCDRYGATTKIDQYGNVTTLERTDDQTVIRNFWGW